MDKRVKPKIDYYECRGCKRRISEIEFLKARYNYPCSGLWNKKCNQTLANYHPIYKEPQDG